MAGNAKGVMVTAFGRRPSRAVYFRLMSHCGLLLKGATTAKCTTMTWKPLLYYSKT